MYAIKERARGVVATLSFLTIIPAAFLATTPAFADQCKLHKFAEFPITMVGLQPTMTAKINDADVQLIVDSGAFYSMLSEASAAQLKLKTIPSPLSLYVSGVHGNATTSLTIVKTFAVPGEALHNIEFLVGGGEVGNGSVGLLGQNFLHIADAEYDLAQGMIRLMKPEDCGKTALAYWAAGQSIPYSVIELQPEPPLTGSSLGSRIPPKELQLSHTIGRAYVNGVSVTAEFDTGADTSILSTKAAARAGIKPDTPGAVAAGLSFGIGKESFSTYIVPVSSFKIGDEEIKKTRLRIGDIELGNADMLIGADFFLSHHIYVANSQKRLYFTYNGGPVFNLTTAGHPGGAAAAVSTTAVTPEAGAGAGAGAGGDAADLARRGAALASRNDFNEALRALTRACELAPDNPSYAYLLGTVYRGLNQPDKAKLEFDRALKLKPDDVQALVARAQLTLQVQDGVAAVADLDAADAAASKAADVRLDIAEAYEKADHLASALTQLTLWIDSHAVDARLPSALNSRCWVRAVSNVDLALALGDCNAALKRTPKASFAYARAADSRGFVYLRLGDYDRSIADYDAAIKIDAKSASSLYGRGIDKLRKQDTAGGAADIASATAVSPAIGELFARSGVNP